MQHPIEIATKTDFPQIEILLEKLQLDRNALDVKQCVVHKKDGRVIAAARVREHLDGTCEFCSLGVYSSERGKGIGKALVSTMLKMYAKKDVWAVTEIPKYFEALGFEIQNIYPNVLKEKQLRCKNELLCSNPQVVLRPLENHA